MTIEVKLNTTPPSNNVASGFSRDSTSIVSPNKKDEALKAEQVNKSDVVEKNPDKKVEKESVDEAVTSLNSSIQNIQRNLRFSVDKDLDRIVINVTDKDTDEVVRQIPSEDVLDLARNLQDIVENRDSSSKKSNEGLFFSSTA